MAMVGGMRQAVGKKCPSRTELARVGGDVQFAGWRVSGLVAAVRQENCRVRNRARARLNWASQGQRCGRCKVRRRADRVSRPAMEKKRRRRVLVVTTCSPRPSRAITWTASQAALAAKRPEGRWLSPMPYFRSRMTFSISAWRRWSASSSEGSPSRTVSRNSCRWRRGPTGNRAWASPVGR